MAAPPTSPIARRSTPWSRAVHDRFGPIDVLVNNVGGNVDFDCVRRLGSGDVGSQDIALNIISTLNCTQAVLPGMIDRSYGRIVNIGSTAGLVGDPMLAVYSAMKGAVHAFTKVLAKEVGKQGITVNAIAPYGTLPDDPERDVSSGSRWHPDGVFARVAATRRDELHAHRPPHRDGTADGPPGGDRRRRGVLRVRRRGVRHRSGARRGRRHADRLSARLR